MEEQAPVQKAQGLFAFSIVRLGVNPVKGEKTGKNLINPFKKTICTKRVSQGEELNHELSTKPSGKGTKNQVMHEVIHIIHKK